MPRIAIWKTGHEIADTVAEALAEGLNGDIFFASNSNSFTFSNDTVSIAYGILRDTDKVFRQTSDEEYKGHWFNVDRGYFNPGHFDGYYRISYCGTQAKWHEGIPRKPIDINIEPWRKTGNYVLICPPTEHVCEFFGVDRQQWIDNACKQSVTSIIRTKETSQPLEHQLAHCKAVITFNSSVGWKALQMGIPVLSDVNHSIIGSHYGAETLEKLTKVLQESCDSRFELMEAMNAHQFTLDEIRQGKAWDLINHYLSSSVSTIEKPLQPMSALTP